MPLVKVKHAACAEHDYIVDETDLHLVECMNCHVNCQVPLQNMQVLPINGPRPHIPQPTWVKVEMFCPFRQQATSECGFLVKPSQGDFETYQMGEDLHAGIVDSQGRVHSFNPDGVRVEDAGWDGAILVEADGNGNTNWFDRQLTNFEHANAHRFTAETYHVHKWNCLHFAADFYSLIQRTQWLGIQFTNAFVLPALNEVKTYFRIRASVEAANGVLWIRRG